MMPPHEPHVDGPAPVSSMPPSESVETHAVPDPVLPAHPQQRSRAPDHHRPPPRSPSLSSSSSSPTAPSKPTSGPDNDAPPAPGRTTHRLRRAVLAPFLYVPPHCRYHTPDDNNDGGGGGKESPHFSWPLTLLFGLAGCVTVANLYYNHPILNLLAADFNISDERASRVPTLAQTGYLSGLIFICPLGDLFPRRPFVLALIAFTAVVWIGLCVTKDFSAFLGLTFLTSLTTVTPQIMLPLVSELAPRNRRATALSIVVSGLALGILLARLLSGVVSNYTSWRAIYWLALGLQSLILALLWLFLPDYPSLNTNTNNTSRGPVTYARMLASIPAIAARHPPLVQACLIAVCTSATFTAFWTTLTFLLAGPPYEYRPLAIGLFALIGLAGAALAPVFSRVIIDRLPTPLYSVVLGNLVCGVGVAVGTAAGPISVAGPVLQALLLDLGLGAAQIGNRANIARLDPAAPNRVNTAFMLGTFAGQLLGTALGNRVYAARGWRPAGALSLGFVALALLLCAARGPRETGWVGWSGGWPALRFVSTKTMVVVADVEEGKEGERKSGGEGEGEQRGQVEKEKEGEGEGEGAARMELGSESGKTGVGSKGTTNVAEEEKEEKKKKMDTAV